MTCPKTLKFRRYDVESPEYCAKIVGIILNGGSFIVNFTAVYLSKLLDHHAVQVQIPT